MFESRNWWRSFNELNELIELRYQNDIELQVKEVEKRSTRIETEINNYNLAGFDLFKSEKFAELNRVKYKDLQDMVFGMELTYKEIIDILDLK